MKNLPNILFAGVQILVTTDIKRALLDLNISDCFTHPGIHIHDDGEWYEDYWFCTFTEKFDYWDRNKSNERAEDQCMAALNKELGQRENHLIIKYRLDKHLLDETPLNKKLFFKKMGGCSGIVTCHKSIKHLFENKGTRLTLIEE